LKIKNIVLICICIITGFFIYKSFLIRVDGTSSNSFNTEKVLCDILSQWFKKKKINDVEFYSFSETLKASFESEGLKVSANIISNPENKMADFFIKAKAANVKAVVFNEVFQMNDPSKESFNEVQNYLNTGGIIYFRNYDPMINENEPFFLVVLEAMKKGQVCIVLPKLAISDVSSLSVKNRALAENTFIDDTNFAEFEIWHKNFVDKKAELMRGPPQP
jgi:uncharacterized protein YwqG